MKFSIKDFCSKCDQIHSFLRVWSRLLKKSLIENFIFCAVKVMRPSSMKSPAPKEERPTSSSTRDVLRVEEPKAEKTNTRTFCKYLLSELGKLIFN